MNIQSNQARGLALAEKLNKVASDLKAVDNNVLFDHDPRESFVSSRSLDGFRNEAEFKPSGELVSLHRKSTSGGLEPWHEHHEEYKITVGAESTKYLCKARVSDEILLTESVTYLESAEISKAGEVLDYTLRTGAGELRDIYDLDDPF